MVNSSAHSPPTAADKFYDYDEHYNGERDTEGRKNGQGENCWSGAKSLESYNGHLFSDTMHGSGFYRWRYYSRPGHFYTFEGHMYANQKHGYGTTSFPDGRVFDGLFINDMRWGPGVESFPYLTQNVGLWRGSQLVRLTWRPPGHSPVPDFLSVPQGKLLVQKHQRILCENCKHVEPAVNSAQELLKHHGCDPLEISKLWKKLYPKHCTDLQSQMCQVEAFEKDYHGKYIICTLSEIQNNEENPSDNYSIDEEVEGEEVVSQSAKPEQKKFYAWNNSELILNIMQHCYKYHKQTKPIGFDISSVLVGPRSRFKAVGWHEKNCRAMFLACYTGNVQIVTRLLNEFFVYQDVTDSAGNNPVMYAACGDNTTIIHFLVQGSASVDYMNDSCCTPLGVVLLRFACVRAGVAPNAMLQALIPPPATTAPQIEDASEWIIHRETSAGSAALQRPSKGTLSTKSNIEYDEIPSCVANVYDDDVAGDYDILKSTYDSKVFNLFHYTSLAPAISYMFHVQNMIDDVGSEDDIALNKKNKSSNAKLSKTFKSSKGAEEVTNTFVEQATSIQEKIHETINQLLCDGANPKLVKVPQPALVIAVTSNCASLVKDLINHGANLHENYPDLLNYTALDLAISQKFTSESVEVVKVLLESGADCNHRLNYTEYDVVTGAEVQIPGPNLLHAILGRNIDAEDTEQEDRRIEILQLLLEHNCDALAQFKGKSALDIAMTKNKNLLCAFIINGYTNLNGIINDSKQTVLVKMFTMSYFKSLESPLRLKILADLVLHGANPLMKCQNDENEYENILVYIDFILNNMKGTVQSTITLDDQDKKSHKGKKTDKKPENSKKATTEKHGKKSKQPDKSKHTDPKLVKSRNFTSSSGDFRDYTLCQKLVMEYAIMLHIRWLQAKLMAELAQVIYKLKHRTWNMIVKDHNRKNAVSIWLTPERCLEIWDILSTTNKKVYTDPLVLKYLLFIVKFYHIAKTLNKIESPCMTAIEKSQVENDIRPLLREYHQQKDKDLLKTLKNLYALPELALNEDARYNVCFECSLPLTDTKVLCDNCKVVAFCNIKCLLKNIDRSDCHPCNEILKMKYLVMVGEE